MAIASCKSLLVALLLASVCGQATARSLLDASTFPYSNKCNALSSGSPYILLGPEPALVDNALNVNLTIIANPAGDASAPCYAPLVNSVFKIVIKSSWQCKGKVQVYVNGLRKKSGLFWDAKKEGEAVLRLTKLDLGTGSLGARLDLVAAAPCNSLAALSGNTEGVLATYMTNNPTIKCCPVNNVVIMGRNGQGEGSAGEVSFEASGEFSGVEPPHNGQGEEGSSASEESS